MLIPRALHTIFNIHHSKQGHPNMCWNEESHQCFVKAESCGVVRGRLLTMFVDHIPHATSGGCRIELGTINILPPSQRWIALASMEGTFGQPSLLCFIERLPNDHKSVAENGCCGVLVHGAKEKKIVALFIGGAACRLVFGAHFSGWIFLRKMSTSMSTLMLRFTTVSTLLWTRQQMMHSAQWTMHSTQ